MEAAAEVQVAGSMQQQVETEGVEATGVEEPEEGVDGGCNRSKRDRCLACNRSSRRGGKQQQQLVGMEEPTDGGDGGGNSMGVDRRQRRREQQQQEWRNQKNVAIKAAATAGQVAGGMQQHTYIH